VTLFALAGCHAKQPTASAPATTQPAVVDSSAPASAPASAGPTLSAPPTAIEFTVDGAGPYQLDATLAALQAAGSLADVTTGGGACPKNTTAKGTGTWGDVQLSFRPDGTLYLLVNKSVSVPTPSGAWLGSTLVQLKTIYKGIPGQTLTRGTGSAYLVTTASGRGILFELDAGKKVAAMYAGDSSYLKSSYATGTYC
jgi:hypothetical protein